MKCGLQSQATLHSLTVRYYCQLSRETERERGQKDTFDAASEVELKAHVVACYGGDEVYISPAVCCCDGSCRGVRSTHITQGVSYNISNSVHDMRCALQQHHQINNTQTHTLHPWHGLESDRRLSPTPKINLLNQGGLVNK